ncbi:hypothetical protein N665_2391s0002 [Sinapis alba]|nr:hypothetical protein N665_2391s0002 [Sinapis alba]
MESSSSEDKNTSDKENDSSNASGEENGPSNVHLQKRQRTENNNIRSAMLISMFLICDNEHLACSSCSSKLRNRCPSCDSSIGQNRCRAMETVLASVFIPCLNAKLGCTENVSFGKESVHKKECNFSPCSCPIQDCNFTGSYIDLYGHYNLCAHKDSMGIPFKCGTAFYIYLNISNKIFIKREFYMKLMFAVQCYREPYGVIADGHTMTYKSPDVKKILEVNLETPQENSMLIPHSLLRGELLDLRLCIKKLNKG